MTRFRTRKCLLGVRKFKFNILRIYSKNSKKNYNGAYGENLEKCSNCHNFGCIQDRVVFFGSTYGFRRRPIQRCHLNLPPTDHCCRGNEIWAKICYNSAYMRDISEILVSNCMGVFGVGLFSDVSQILPRPTLVATKFWGIWPKIGYNLVCIRDYVVILVHCSSCSSGSPNSSSHQLRNVTQICIFC